MPDTPIDLAAERAAARSRQDVRAGRAPTPRPPVAEPAPTPAANLEGTRHSGGAKLDPEERERLRDRIRELLREDPEMSAAEAHRRLDPGIGYVTFQTTYFRPLQRAATRTAPPIPSPTRTPMPKTPEPKVVPLPARQSVEAAVLSQVERAAEFNRGFADAYLALLPYLHSVPALVRATGTDGLERLTVESR